MNRFAVVAAVVLLGLSGGRASVDARVMPRPLQVLYVEASIAERWRLEQFPSRVGDSRFVIRSRAEYAFDKSPALERALADSATRPDVIVLQECAVYFPGPLAAYQRLLRSWVEQIRRAGTTPILVTTIPPARGQRLMATLKDRIKTDLLRRPRQHDQILVFNGWLRDLARSEDLILLDLEVILRSGPGDAHLAPRFDSGDGIHPSAAAYDLIDHALLEVLRQVDKP